jgi:hypothetical protein
MAVLIFALPYWCARAETYQGFVTAGTSCYDNVQTGKPPEQIIFNDVPCTGTGGASIIGSGKVGPLYLGARIESSSTPSHGGDVGVNFDMGAQVNQLATTISGGQIVFYWAMEGIVSLSADSVVRLNVLGRVNGTTVINPPPPGLGLTGPAQTFFSTILASSPVPLSSSPNYDIYMGFDNIVSGPGSSNFLNTIRLSEIAVTDIATGNPIDGVVFTLSDGETIPTNQPLLGTPEPVPALLMAGGLGLIGIYRRRLFATQRLRQCRRDDCTSYCRTRGSKRATVS